MPKPINWEQFTQLTAEERAEMKTFVDTYGAELEKTLGIEMNEDYIKTQIDQNMTRYRNGKQYVQASKFAHETAKKFPRPKDASGEIFARGYPIYMTDNEQDNLALQASLETKEGRQAFVNRLVKDMMELDLTQTHLSDLDKEMEFAIKNPAVAELGYLTHNLSTMADGEYKLDEPLLTAFNDKAKLIEFSSSSAHLCKYAASPLGLLLPEPDEAMAMKMFASGNLLKKYGDELVSITSYVTQMSKETENFQKMAKAGMLDNNVRLKDANGNYLEKGRVMRGNTPCTAEPLKPEAAKALSDQMNTMPAFKYASEVTAELKAQGLEVELDAVTAAMTGKGVGLVFQGDEPYPRKMEFDAKTQKITMGEPVTEVPALPEKPGFFKRLFHSMNSNWFKADFDKYEKDVKACRDTETAFNKAMKENEERKAAERQRKSAEKAGKKAKEDALKERVAEEKMKDSKLETIKEEVMPKAITEMQEQYHNPNLPDGPYKQVLGMAVQARERIYEAYKNKKPYREMAQDMRTMIVERMLDDDRRSIGVNYGAGRISYDLSRSKDPTAVENFVKNVDLGRTMDNITKTITPYRNESGKTVFHRETMGVMRSFALGNGAEEAFNLCKKSLAEEHKDLGQMQKPKEIEQKQKVAKNPEVKAKSSPNVLN